MATHISKKEWDQRKENNCINKQTAYVALYLAMAFQVQTHDVSE